jgi:hypothetical protein
MTMARHRKDGALDPAAALEAESFREGVIDALRIALRVAEESRTVDELRERLGRLQEEALARVRELEPDYDGRIGRPSHE